jgi:hypothetical protein
VVSSGRDCIGTCEARTFVTRAPALEAMNSCVFGGMALSCVASRYQNGMVRHAGAGGRLGERGHRERPLGGLHEARRPFREVAGERGPENARLQVQVGAGLPSGRGYGRSMSASGVMWVPGFIVTSWASDSPVSGAKAAMYQCLDVGYADGRTGDDRSPIRLPTMWAHRHGSGATAAYACYDQIWTSPPARRCRPHRRRAPASLRGARDRAAHAACPLCTRSVVG